MIGLKFCRDNKRYTLINIIGSDFLVQLSEDDCWFKEYLSVDFVELSSFELYLKVDQVYMSDSNRWLITDIYNHFDNYKVELRDLKGEVSVCEYNTFIDCIDDEGLVECEDFFEEDYLTSL